MGKILGRIFGVIIFLMLIPILFLPLLGDIAMIIMASMPWWVRMAFIAFAVLIVALIVRMFLPRRHRHDHYHH